MALSHTLVLNLKLERLCLAKKCLKDCGSSVTINSFCISNNIPYTALYDWFKKTQKKIVPVEVEDILEELEQSGNGEQDVTKEKPKRISINIGSIMVNDKNS